MNEDRQTTLTPAETTAVRDALAFLLDDGGLPLDLEALAALQARLNADADTDR